jgi:hypothetical protein
MTRRSSLRTGELFAEVRRALGDPRPTLLGITQEPFDYDPAHLFSLVGLPRGDEPDPGDLVDYCLDFQYEAVQGDLFRYALPLCLRAWRQTLLGETTLYEAFVEHFYPALVDGGVFERLLSDEEGRAVSHFIEQSILDEIEAQAELAFRSSDRSAYRWVRTLTTSGVVLPNVASMWRAWWSIDNAGQACAAMQFASCLIYDEHDNPIFEPWSRTEGGGPPSLWEYAGHLYDRRWRDENVSFLREALTPDTLGDMLNRAVNRLAALPTGPKALEVYAAFAARLEVVRSRCRELPDLLATTQAPAAHLAWSR